MLEHNKKAGVNKLPLFLQGKKSLKNSSQGRVAVDLILLTCTLGAINSNCFLPNEGATEIESERVLPPAG